MNNENKNIEIINNIKFTNKEIEIISCIVGNAIYKKNKERPEKSIESLICININTLNTHLRNIKLKIKCSRQEEIAEFVESSKQYEFIIDKYIEIFAKYEFDKILKNINLKNINNNYECEIHVCECKDNEKNKIFAESLKKAGINIKLSFENNIPNNFNPNCFHVVYTETDNKNIILNIPDILFVVNYNNKLCSINKEKNFDFYRGTLECINKICKNKQIKKMIDDFEIFCAKLNNKYIYNNLSKPIKKPVEYKQYLVLFVSFFICLCLIGNYINFNKTREITNIILLDKKLLLPRSDFIKKINYTFDKQDNKKIVVLIGQAGMGKTILSKLYLQTQNSKIKWELNAQTKESLLEAFFDLATVLAESNKLKEDLIYIKSCQNRDEKIKQLTFFVFSILNNKKKSYLLFDNVEDFQTIKDFLPLSLNFKGNIVITTRNEPLKNIAYFPRQCSISIKDLSKKEKFNLFCDILYDNNKNFDKKKSKKIEEFLQNIPSMPLDVSAAAYYLKNTNETFDGYITLTKKITKDFEKLHGKFIFENMDYSATRYGIITSTLKQILQHNPDFEELLLFICLGDSQNIPKNFRGLKSTTVINDFLHYLRKHSLIVDSEDFFSIHKSTQKIGLDYIMSTLSQATLEQCMNNIVKNMTHYEKVISIWYRSGTGGGLTIVERTQILSHIKNMIANCKIYSNLKNQNEYKTKLLLMDLYLTEDIKLPSDRIHDLEKVIKLNNNGKYIQDYDYAVMLLEHAYISCLSGKDEISNNHLFESLKVCEKLENVENVKALCYAFLGRSFFANNNEQEGNKFLDNAVKIISNMSCACATKTKVYVYNQYFWGIKGYYIFGKNVKKTINFLQKTLEELGASKFFYKNPDSLKKVPFFISELRKNLIIGYNAIEDYDMALECAKEVYFLYDKIDRQGKRLLMREALLDIEYGLTLLRKNNLNEATKILTRAIDSKLKIQDYQNLFNALVYRTEAKVRLGKYREAYEDCMKALNLSKSHQSNNNFAKLQKITCYYNMAIVKYKQKQIFEFLKYFDEFFKQAKIFCKTFLDDVKLKDLNEMKVFEFHKDLKICLKNSSKIFAAIYGKDHAFVKYYVRKNKVD